MSSTCAGTEPYTVTWSTHAIFDPAAVPLDLTVTVVRPTTHDYVRPSETISFVISTTTPEKVVYLVDFNDARSPQTLMTTDGTVVSPVVSLMVSPVVSYWTDGTVAHAWSSSGNYSVNVTAVIRTNSATKVLPVQIHDVEEGVPPENLAIKADIDHRDT